MNGICFSKDKAGSSGSKGKAKMAVAISEVGGVSKTAGQDAMSLFEGRLRKKVELLMRVIYVSRDDELPKSKQNDPAAIAEWEAKLCSEVCEELGMEPGSLVLEFEKYYSYHNLTGPLAKHIAAELPENGKPAALLELIELIMEPDVRRRTEGMEELKAKNEELKSRTGADVFNPRDSDWEDRNIHSELSRLRTMGQALSFADEELQYAVLDIIGELLDAPGVTTKDLESALKAYNRNGSGNDVDGEYGEIIFHELFASLMRGISEERYPSERLEAIGMDEGELRAYSEMWGIEEKPTF